LKSKHLYEFGCYRLDHVERVLLRDGHPSPSRKGPGNLLVLVERAGHIVEKEELLEKVWPGFSSRKAIWPAASSTCVRCWGDSEDGRKYIETIPKRGYRFVAAVREDGEPPRLIQRPHRLLSQLQLRYRAPRAKEKLWVWR